MKSNVTLVVYECSFAARSWSTSANPWMDFLQVA